MLESAVSLFSKIWSTPCQRQPTPCSTSIRGRPSNNLPAELLLIIFKLVYENEFRRFPPWSARQTWQELDLRSPSLFPYAIAAVCSLWRDVMSLVPEFWTRVVILVDPPTTPLLVVTSLLSWSRDLSIDVTLARRAFDYPVDGTQERTQLISVLKVLQRQIHRIDELHIHVMFSSSLPSFPDDFHGKANILTALKLQCNEDDGGHLSALDSGQSANSPEHEPFQCPKLFHLAIDGRNCYNAHLRGSWCTYIAPNLERLAVSHYRPQPGESFSAYDLVHPLTTIRGLKSVSIGNVAFDPTNRIQSCGARVGLVKLSVEDCHDFHDIAQIFRVLGGAFHASFTRCAVGPPPGGFCDFDIGSVLTLRRISGDQDLVPLLCSWDGFHLEIEDCPGFDDVVLTAMGTRVNGTFVCAPDLISFVISTTDHATTFSVDALKRFVETRLVKPNHGADDEHSEFTRFHSIDVRGNAPYLSQEDRAWFIEKTQTFRYP